MVAHTADHRPAYRPVHDRQGASGEVSRRRCCHCFGAGEPVAGGIEVDGAVPAFVVGPGAGSFSAPP